MSRKAVGTLLVCISGTAFGTYGLFATYATKQGLGTLSLLLFRFGIAAGILGILALLAKSPFPRGKAFLPLIGLGLIYVGQAFTFLKCLEASDPIVTSLLLYLYPVWVTLGSVLFLHEKLTRTKVVALLSAIVGSVLIIGPVSGVPPVAIGYGLATSVFYATYLVAGKYVLKNYDSLVATLIIITTATVVFLVAAAATGIQFPASPGAWMGAIGLAIVATVVAIGTLLAGLSRISAVEASSLSALEPLVSAALAIALLGTKLHIYHLNGGVLVLAAVIVLARHTGDPDPESTR